MLKQKELLLLTHFRKNARNSLTSISKATKIPVSTLFEKIKNFEKEIIRKHTTLINFNKIGYLAKANVMLQIAANSREEAKEYLKKHQNVNSFYKVNNGFDFLAELVFKDMKELENFIETLETKFEIKNKAIYYVIEDITREKFMSDANLINIAS